MEGVRSELFEISKVVPKDEFFEIAEMAFKEALKITLKMKVRDFFKFIETVIKGTYEFTKYLITTLSIHRLEAPKVWFRDIKNTVIEKANSVRSIWKNLNTRQKINTLIDISIFGLTAFLVSGGADLEGGLPDADLKAGIGLHRNLFTHTILMGLLVEFVIRFLVRLSLEASKRGYIPKSKLLQIFIDFGKEHEKAMIGGLWFGLFLHFLKDANIFGGRTKPYVGLKGQAMQIHKDMMASNAILSVIFTQQSEAEQ